MTKYLFAAAVVALFAAAGTAEEKPVVAASAPIVSAAPVVVTGTPVVQSTPAQTNRRGLFGRMRGRNNTPAMVATPAVMMSAPMMTAPTPALTTPAPKPMLGAMATPEVPGGIVPAGGAIGNPTTSYYGPVMSAGYNQPTVMAAPTSNATRRGLFGRLRNR